MRAHRGIAYRITPIDHPLLCDVAHPRKARWTLCQRGGLGQYDRGLGEIRGRLIAEFAADEFDVTGIFQNVLFFHVLKSAIVETNPSDFGSRKTGDVEHAWRLPNDDLFHHDISSGW